MRARFPLSVEKVTWRVAWGESLCAEGTPPRDSVVGPIGLSCASFLDMEVWSIISSNDLDIERSLASGTFGGA